MIIDKIIYAGHSAVLIHCGEQRVAVDPWLEGNPRCPQALKNPARLDLIVLTHGHADHAGDVTRLARETGAKVCATYELAMLLGKEGIPEQSLVPMNKGGTVTIGDISVSLTHALHSNSYDTAEGPAYAGEACGAVIAAGGSAIYHAGDTALFSDIALIGRKFAPQIAFLPIGDCFTMGPEEAAEAAKLSGCRLAVPIHYATFEALTGTSDRFEAACRKVGVEPRVLAPGASLTLG